MKVFAVLCTFVAGLSVLADRGICGENAFSVGYGFAAFNLQRQTGKLEGGKRYDFEWYRTHTKDPFYGKGWSCWSWYAAYVQDPTNGTDFGVGIGFKYYPFNKDKNDGFFMTAGTGMAYSTIGFEEQGTHLFFIGQGGLNLPFRQLLYRRQVPSQPFERWYGASQLVGKRKRRSGRDIFLRRRDGAMHALPYGGPAQQAYA